MFYFAAASFSELSRRLHGDAWSRGFLLAGDDAITSAMGDLHPSGFWGSRAAGYAARIASAIDPVNVAGLADEAKRNWYGVDVDDTVRAAHKLEVEPDVIRKLIAVIT
jgi:hypothetical protein